jgi:iron complex outermembrane recepter protein
MSMNSASRHLFARTLVAAAIKLAWCGTAAAQPANPPAGPLPVSASPAASAPEAVLPTPSAEPAKPAESAKPTAGEQTVIVITGTRASLMRARELKRNATIVQDSISAEDLGRFPDDNVADSLSHITGITISRTHGGEGQYVNVRGLGPNYSIVTLNGRILATDGDGREFAFDVLPSETISGADVLKSAQASQLEGSIGGSVNLRSARPLDKPGFQSSLRLEGDWNDLSRTGGGKISGVISNTFADNHIGVLLGVVYGKSKSRSDSLLDFTYNPDAPGEFDANGDGTITADEQNLIGTCCVAFGSLTQEKKRAAISGALQWKPNDEVTLTLDLLATRLDAPAIGNHQAYYVEHAEDRWTDVTIKDHLVTGMTILGLTPEVVTRIEDRVVDTNQIGLNGSWKTSDALTLTGDIYHSNSKRDSGGKDAFVVAGIPGNHTGYFQANNDSLPDIRVTLEDGRDLAAASPTLGNNDYALHYVELAGTDIKDTVSGLSFGGRLATDWNALEAVQFGFNGSNRRKTRRTIDNLDNVCQYCNYNYTFGQLGADVVHTLTLPNFLRNGGGNFPKTFVRFDVPAYLQALKALDGVEILDENGNGTGSVYDSSLMNPVFSPTKSYDVQEKTLAAYVETDFSGDNWFGNLGLRVVHTKTTSKSAVNRIVAIDDPTPDDPTSSPTVTYSEAEPVTQTGSYTKVLPSLNFGYSIRPDLLARFGLAKVMARPSLDQLAPTAVDYTLDRTYLIEIAGDAGLKPVEATQGDLSLEWYYNRRSMLTGAVYWKDIKNFVTTRLDENVDIGVAGYAFDIRRPINGDKAKVRGLELGWQHLFDNGFGINVKYSYTDTQATIDGVAVGELEGVSKSAYSLSLLYEDDRINAQIALDHSGRYTEVLDAVGGLTRYGDPIDWVTASVAYNVTKDLSVFVEGRNLTDAFYRANLGRADALAGFETWGRTYVAGVTVKF